MSSHQPGLKPTRIAILSWESRHSIAVGGLAQHVSELAAALGRRGHEVHVITRRGIGQAAFDQVDGACYHRCHYDGHADIVTDVARMCDSFTERLAEVESQLGRPFDIVHGHDWLCAKALERVRRVHQRRIVLTMHSTEFGRCGNQHCNGLSLRIRDAEWEATYLAERVICVSHALRREVQQLYAVPDDKLHVAYNGVDVRRFDEKVDVDSVRRRHAVGLDDPLVLFAGRLAWQKGPDLLLDALPGVLYRHPRTKLLFAGEGDMRSSLERRAAAMGVQHAIRFAGFCSGSELVGLFKCADLVCVPSRNEPFGIVILEAWGASKPVVATRRGGPAEFVRHEDTGLTVADNVGSIGWGVSHLLDDADNGRRLGRNGRREAETRFSWDTIAAATEQVYESLLTDKPIRASAPESVSTEDTQMARQRTAKAPANTAKLRKATTRQTRGPVKTKTVKEVVGALEPTLEAIRQRAYELYLTRDGRSGDPAADWLQAERELRAQAHWQSNQSSLA